MRYALECVVRMAFPVIARVSFVAQRRRESAKTSNECFDKKFHSKTGKRSNVRSISCATVAFGASLLAFTAHAQLSPSFVSMGYALRAPNFNDANDVGQHAAFAAILGALLRENIERVSGGSCALFSGAQFPDLNFQLKAPLWSTLKECANRLSLSLVSGSFDQGLFRSVVSNLIQSSRPISLQDGNFTSRQLSNTRLRVVGQAILAKIYANDPVLEPLLAIHDRLSSHEVSYDAFTNWLASQRKSTVAGFYGRAAWETKELLALGLPISRPSIPPELPRPYIPKNNEMTLNAPNVRGESFIFVACNTASSSQCIRELYRAFCSKPGDQISRTSSPDTALPDTRLKCRIINICGLSKWITAEADDERVLKEVFERLQSRTLGSSAPDPALIEFSAFVKTE